MEYVLLGGGVLFLLSALGKKPEQPQQPPQTKPPAGPNAGQQVLATTGAVVGIATGIAGTVGTLTTLFGGGSAATTAVAAGGTTAAVGTGAAAGGGGTGAAAGSTGATAASTAALVTTGFFSVEVGALAGILFTAVIVAAIWNTAARYAQRAHYAEQNSTFASGFSIARDFMLVLLKDVTTYTSAGSGTQTKINLRADELRQVVQCCLYLAIQMIMARNDALVRYYQFLRWDAASIRNGIQGVPNTGAVVNPDPLSFIPQTAGQNPLQATKLIIDSLNMAIDNTYYATATKPFTSYADLEASAKLVLKDKFQTVVNALRFQGIAAAMLVASIEGYSATWPGDERFAKAIAYIVGGPDWDGHTEQSLKWITNSPSPWPQVAWWITDPYSGNSIAPINSRDALQLVISVKGTEVSPGVFAGYVPTRLPARSDFARYSGRRVNRFAIMTRGRYGR